MQRHFSCFRKGLPLFVELRCLQFVEHCSLQLFVELCSYVNVLGSVTASSGQLAFILDAYVAGTKPPTNSLWLKFADCLF